MIVADIDYIANNSGGDMKGKFATHHGTIIKFEKKEDDLKPPTTCLISQKKISIASPS